MAQDLFAPGRLHVGINAQDARTERVAIVGNDNNTTITLEQYSGDTAAPTFNYNKARGTNLVPADAQINDRILDIKMFAYSGSFLSGGAVRGYVDGPGPLVSGQRTPTRLEWETNLLNTAPASNMALFSNGFLVLGSAKVTRGIAALTEVGGLLHIGGNSTVEAYIERASGDATAPNLVIRKSRGTLAAPININNGDELGQVKSQAYSGSFLDTASIRFQITNSVTGGQRPPSSIFFYTNVNNAAAIKQAAVFSTGFLAVGTDLVVGGDDLALGILHLGGNSTVTEYVQRSSTDATAAEIRFMKSRGTVTANSDVASDDSMLNVSAYARSSSTWFQTTRMRSLVDGTFTSGQRPPSRIEFETNIANTAATTKMVISSGSVGFVGISDGLFTVTERPSAHLHILGQTGDVHLHVEKVSTDANPPLFEGFKARGTVAARSNVAVNDYTALFEGFAYSNSYFDGAILKFAVDATFTAGQAPPSRMEFYTNAANTAPTLQCVLNSNGYWIHGPAGAALAIGSTILPGDGHILSSDSGESARHMYLQRASTSNGPNFICRRQRGSFGTPANVQTDDRVVRLAGQAYSGATGYWDTARIDTFIDGTVTDNQRPGSRISFLTNAPNATVTERMVIIGTGEVGIGNTPPTNRFLFVQNSNAGTAPVRFENPQGGATAHVLFLLGGENTQSGSADFVSFQRPDGTQIGRIEQATSTTVAYQTSSDQRLKENIKDAGDALAVIKDILVRSYTWKVSGEKIDFGLIAQELHPVYPRPVSVGDEDETVTKPDGTTEVIKGEKVNPWMIDYSQLTPLLLKAIQQLENRLTKAGF